jgi:hypothetical protein
MTLSDLASIGSLVSGVAVLISLIYLSVQVRQAERNQRALMQQGRAARVCDSTLRVADPGMSEIFRRGNAGDENLKVDQLRQFTLMCRAGFVSGEDSFLQYLSGQLDEAAYRSYVAGVRSIFSAPGMRAMWRMSSQQYGKEYRKFMDSILDETQPVLQSDQLARWIGSVREEKEGVTASG